MQTTEHPMVKDRPEVIAIHNRTLNTLTRELGSECQKVVTLLGQLQLRDLSASQQATILAELLACRMSLRISGDSAHQSPCRARRHDRSEACQPSS
jgi:hypothetical protein